MPSLRAGECLLIGDAVVLPSIVQSDKCDPSPASSDIPYFQLWKEKWVHFDVEAVKTLWEKQRSDMADNGIDYLPLNFFQDFPYSIMHFVAND